MAWTKMSTVPNPVMDSNGDVASGYVLKCYLPGTTTATSIATDSSGGTTVASMTTNAAGVWETSGNEVLPHIDRKVKWGIFQNSTHAAANTPFAIGPFDNVEQSSSTQSDNPTPAFIETQLGSAAVSRVFTLTLFAYQVGATNTANLMVFRNGQKLTKGVTADYTETNSTTVTLTFDPNDNDSFDFIASTSVATAVADASTVTYTPAGSGAVATDVQTKLRESVSVKDFGAVGDGVADDAAAIQAAIDAIETAGGGTIFFPYGDYRLSVTKGTNDKYGIQIGGSNIKLKGEKGASIRRLSSDISSYALSFPLLLVGVPDNNATQLLDVEIDGLEFVGEDTRHTTSGSALMDGRQAIWVKNVKGFKATNCKFDQIDSSAIWFQFPASYDYENSAYYNTTKCYDVLIKDCEFVAASHSTAGRALLHAIVAKVDNCRVIDNYFEWCDDALTCSTTYDDYEDVETDTYTDTNLGSAVKRAGRGYVIKGNDVLNSSEHAFYLEAMGITASDNTITVTDSTTCNTVQYQIRGRNVSVSGGALTGVYQAAAINVGSMDVSFKPGPIYAVGDTAGGIVNIKSEGLTAYIDARSDFFGSYKPMRNIRVDCNISMPEASQTNGVGIRLYTDTTDSNFPLGQMQNVNLRGTTITNPMHGVLAICPLARNVQTCGMIIMGKPLASETYFGYQGAHDGSGNAATLTDSGESFTTNEFVGWTLNNLTDGSTTTVTANTATTITGTLSGGTDNDWDASDVYQLIPPVTSVGALSVDDGGSMTTVLRQFTFDDNTVRGFQSVVWDYGGAGGAGTFDIPYGIRNNRMDYIKDWDTAAFKSPDFENRFKNNSGRFFLDRTGWTSNTALENALSDGTGNSEKRSCLQLVGAADVRIYYDDDGNYKAL